MNTKECIMAIVFTALATACPAAPVTDGGTENAPGAKADGSLKKAARLERGGAGEQLTVHDDILSGSKDGETRVVVDIERPRAYLLVDDVVALETPVSTARRGKRTPRGSFLITERVRHGKHSSIYGCAMPYWMRLDESAYGLHVGKLPGYPASAGCVRLPPMAAQLIFSHTRSGTPVTIVDSWEEQPGMVVAQAYRHSAPRNDP